MKIVKSRMITEKIPLKDCSAGDIVRFLTFDLMHGTIQIVKIKTIPKNKIQIKWLSTWRWRNRNNTVQKTDVPSGIIVERTRKADARDQTDVKECEIEILS